MCSGDRYPYQAMKLMLKRLGVQAIKTSPQTLLPVDIYNNVKIPEFDPIHAQQALTRFFSALKRSQESSDGATLQQIMKTQFGFWLEKHPSLIPNAGNGVFLRGGHADPGVIVAMYPGTLYRPGEAIFFSSLHNRYILKCNDGVYVDGKSNGESWLLFNSFRGSYYADLILSFLFFLSCFCRSLRVHLPILEQPRQLPRDHTNSGHHLDDLSTKEPARDWADCQQWHQPIPTQW